ncbi:hypothetical protein RJT34_23813 [Clitoria ternatea]|uniref:Uncharacterized protein n=1 Tax=Clitoria ternatea TaxID=43366 RepID=A0AAN9FLQ1_CLITE
MACGGRCMSSTPSSAVSSLIGGRESSTLKLSSRPSTLFAGSTFSSLKPVSSTFSARIARSSSSDRSLGSLCRVLRGGHNRSYPIDRGARLRF